MAPRTIELEGYKHTIHDLHHRDAIRWAVGAKDGRRSSTWRMWGDKKGDVYLSVRSMGAILKVSLHRDRRCSVGFTKEFEPEAKERFSASNRHWQRWVMPNSPIVKGFQILIPESELAEFASEEKEPMAWIPAPGEGRAVVFTVFIAEPPGELSWESPEKSGNLLGMMLCPTRAAWLVHTSYELDVDTLRMIEDGRTRTLKTAEVPLKGASPEGLRMALFGNRSETDVFFIELNASRYAGKQDKSTS